MVSIRIVATKRRTRSASMRIVSNREIELRVPKVLRVEDIADFVSRNTAFLQKSSTVTGKAPRKSLSTGNIISVFGLDMRVDFKKSRQTRIEIDKESRVVTIFKSGSASIPISRFYKASNAYLLPILEDYSAKAQQLLHIELLQGVRLKKVRSIWGSCSRRGYITYNSRLIHYPEATLWYIVCHEVSHLIEHNHSKNFWDLVKQLCPNYKTERLVLKNHTYG